MDAQPTPTANTPFAQSKRLADVTYDVRGPILQEAARIEAEGHEILRLNLGNMYPFGLEARGDIVAAVTDSIEPAEAYSDSKGILAARQAVAAHYESVGVRPGIDPENVFLGNGVSELITLALQAIVDPGDEILVPAPDYPTWTGAVNLTGGVPVHYLANEANDWNPSLEDIAAKITPRTKALVLINPNNPTGAVYSEEIVRGMAELARRHDLILLSDEIYEHLTFGGAQHHHAAIAAGGDVLCLTFGGLSKAFRVCGFRAGWLAVSGPVECATDLLEGIGLLSNMRVCPNVPGQYAIPAALSIPAEDLQEVVDPGGSLADRVTATAALLGEIDGVSCVAPKGALYCFARYEPAEFDFADDEAFALALLREENILVTRGTGFNWPQSDHFRIACLPDKATLAGAVAQIGDFLDRHRTGLATTP
ncbi:aminotransferase class I/II-fold pyridoxal phosphate-dependent enzyme [Dietzia sp.]|uniref:aminotransferase class I/II-fold pyridoxal phosphate-dependent enzyme n=1 Tax=Dietzia sp. TaxID=1871616 RepID=UPI002FD88F95